MGFLPHGNPLGFDQPFYLLLLSVAPLVIWLSTRSLSGMGAGRRIVAVGLRLALMLVLVLVLAGMHHLRFVNDRVVVFVLDKSQSVPRGLQNAAFQFVKEAAAFLRPGRDRVAVLSFDGRTSIEQLLAGALKVDGVDRNLAPDETDLASALRMAAALVPGDASARIIVLSDGNETAGSAETEARTLAALHTPVDVVPLDFQHENEVVFERLEAPASAQAGETIGLQFVFRSQKRVKGRVRLFHGEREIRGGDGAGEAGHAVTLEPGVNRMTFPIRLAANGVHRFRGEFVPDSPNADTLTGNNYGETFTRVGGRERVLILGTDDADGEGGEHRAMQVVADALAAQSIECDVVDVAQASLDAPSLAPYASVILSNVSAVDLGDGGPAALASYTRDLGGGLIVIGGDQSFSVGGYYDTVLEEILPVETNRRRLVTLNLGLVLVIDRSGSMQGQKLELAIQAAAASAKLLSSLDRIGVIAFDTDFEWAVPLRLCADKDAVIRQIRRIGPGGGTAMQPAMHEAVQMLKGAPVSLKHIILLTDGQSMPGDFEGTAREAHANNITMTTIAVGPDADRALLHQIAKIAGGRSYAAIDGRPLPRIFARETMLAGRASVQEGRFTPTVRPELDDLLIKGLVSEGMPPLDGYVVTRPKPTASVLLVNHTDRGDHPILAHWQVGLGRALAFTSGMWPKWGRDWIQWPAFSPFWSQIARWASRSFGEHDAMIWTRVDGRTATVTVELDAWNGEASPTGPLTAQVVDPDHRVTPIALNPVGAGRYEAEFRIGAAGSYVVNVTRQDRQLTSLVRAGVTVAYSPEFSEIRSNPSLLHRLAEATGGRRLGMDEAKRVFDPAAFTDTRVRQTFHRELLMIALVILVLDVAARRVALRWSDVSAWMARRFGLARPVALQAQRQTMAALRGARDRARVESEVQPSAGVAPPPNRARPSTEATPKSANTLGGGHPDTDSDRATSPVDAEPPSPPAAPPEAVAPASDNASEDGLTTTARLLSKRRNRR